MMARLVVSDDDETRRATRMRLLREHGHEVVGVEDGRAARAWLRITPVDVVLLELLNVGEDGLRTIYELRREFPRVPIVASCAACSNASFYCILAERMGAARACPNPTDDTLAAAVTAALGRAHFAPPTSTASAKWHVIAAV